MEDMMRKFIEQADAVFKGEERAQLGLDARKDYQKMLDESLVDITVGRNNRLMTDEEERKMIRDNRNGKFDMVFEDVEDASYLFDFMINHKLMHNGEIVLSEGKNGATVSFSKEAVAAKPEMVQAAMLTFEKQLDLDDDESVDVLEDVISELDNVLTEAATSGAPKKGVKGNPYHGKNDGKFASPGDHLANKGGSWAMGKRKLKFTGKGKAKGGGVMAKYGSTKHPCGRAARAKGKDVRCWDGNKGLGLAARISRVMKGKKRRYEDLDVAGLMLIAETRDMYNKR